MGGIANRAATRTLVVVGIAAIYAACFVAIKAGLSYAPPLLFGGLRALIGGAGLFGLAIALRRPLLPRRRYWGWILALALLSTTFAFGAMFLSPGRTGVGIASVLGNTQPLIAVALAAAFLGERLTRAKSLTLVLGFVGVALISYRALTGPEAYGLSGALLALAASAGTAGGSVVVKRMDPRNGLLVVAAWQLVLGSLPLLVVSALFERDAGIVWSAEFVGLLLFLALAGTSFATAVWYWLIERDEVGHLTMFFYLIPVLGLGMAALAFREEVGILEGAGALLTVAGLGPAARESWRRLEPSPLASSIEDAGRKEVSEVAKDPVCGMTVEEKKAAGKSEYQGQTYYFCSLGCKVAFDKEPQKYAGKK